MQNQRKGACALLTETQEVLSRAEVTISQTKETVPLMASTGLRWGCAGSEASVKSVENYTREKQDEDCVSTVLTMTPPHSCTSSSSYTPQLRTLKRLRKQRCS